MKYKKNNSIGRLHKKLSYSKMKKHKLFLAATSGGHLTQILTLIPDLEGFEQVVFSEKCSRLQTIPHKTYGYRRPQSPFWTTVVAFFYVFFIIMKEHPDWIISTGAECGTAAIIAGKLLFCKTMFIETASRYRTKTMSAKICYPLVDKFYVQYEESLLIYGPKAEYIGGIL